MNFDKAYAEAATLCGVREWVDAQTIKALRTFLDSSICLANENLPTIGHFEYNVAYHAAEDRNLTLDVLVPGTNGPYPVLVYLHGGGWIWGSPVTHRKLTYRLAQEGFLVMSVDYRLAPEHPFPAAFEDAIEAIYFAQREATRWHGNPNAMVLAGDSAGANLAAVSAIELSKREQAPRITALGLMYGAFDLTASEQEDPVSQAIVKAYFDGKTSLETDRRVSPILTPEALPLTHLVVGGSDPILAEVRDFHQAILDVGGSSDLNVYPNMPHGFAQMEIFPEARQSLKNMAAYLHAALDTQL